MPIPPNHRPLLAALLLALLGEAWGAAPGLAEGLVPPPGPALPPGWGGPDLPYPFGGGPPPGPPVPAPADVPNGGAQPPGPTAAPWDVPDSAPGEVWRTPGREPSRVQGDAAGGWG